MSSERSVGRTEWRWLIVASAAVLLIASMPTLYAWHLADADHVFTGFVYNAEDGNWYISRMRLGARGELLFHFVYSAEPHEPALVYTFYLLLGRLAATLALPLRLAYHLARVLLGLGLLLSVYYFVAHFTADVLTRRVAWLLVTLGSGLGWLLVLMGASQWLGDMPIDFRVPEAYAFLVVYNLPHLALAQSALLWSLHWTLQAFEEGGWRSSVLAAGAAFLMAWVVPFYAGVLAAAVGAYLLALALRRRHLPWREVGLAAATGSGALPVVAYNAWAFTTNPALAALSAQNQIPSPHPLHYLLGFLLFLVPAAWGTAHVLKLREERWLLPIAWVAVVPLLVYVPLNVQRRMIAGAQVPLALLAATGLVGWFRGRRRALAGYVAVTTLSTWLLVFGNLAPIAHRNQPIYRPGGEVAALRWLDTHARAGDIALASFEVGNVIPAYTDLRVFAGHGPETLHNQTKREALQRFFQAATDDAWRRNLLAESGVDYLFYGPQEAQLATWDPDSADYLTLRYRAGDYAIYAVGVEAVD